MLSGVIKSFRTGAQNGEYTVTRKTDGGFTSDGYPVEPTTKTIKIIASVQPFGADRIQALPDGVRIEDASLLFTTTPLHGSTSTDRSDIVSIEGALHTVVSVSGPWQLGKSIHYEVVLKKQTVGNVS